MESRASADRGNLQERCLRMTRDRLPAAARKGWRAIRLDHCFTQIILDRLFEASWHEHLDRRIRAYQQLNGQQLERAVAPGERMLAEGEPRILEMNMRSLRWRGK